jgi:hypothetical protein
VGISGMLSRSEYRPTRIMADSSGRVRFIVGKINEGLPARGSWWGMKRTDGRCFTAAPSAPLSVSALAGPGVEAGVGPLLLRTWSWGWLDSERVLVMFGGGVWGGESLDCGWDWDSGGASAVCLRDSGAWRVLGGGWDEEAKAGDAGGV